MVQTLVVLVAVGFSVALVIVEELGGILHF
ncbi:MAG: hypothetical protein QOH24_1237 [Verrucomicrobiota bacterium]|jgi:hypothetical protein